jgi:hypothetical protein
MTNYWEIIITIGSLAAMMWGMLRFMLRDIHEDLSDIKQDMKRSEKRIDHLYEICIDMLKERK